MKKLEPWELARVAKMLEDEIYERTTGRFSKEHPLGDPQTITAMEHALAILYASTKKRK